MKAQQIAVAIVVLLIVAALAPSPGLRVLAGELVFTAAAVYGMDHAFRLLVRWRNS